MEVMLAEYVNARRAEMALWLLAKEKRASLVPVSGTFTLMDRGVKCWTDQLEVLSFPGEGITPVLVRVVHKPAAGKSAVEVSPFLQKKDTLYQQLVQMCKAKFAVSKNQFVMECASDGCTLSISSNTDESISYVVKSPVGDAFMSDDSSTADLIAGCKSIKSFSFRMVTEQCEKDVCVKRGQVEIFREISHYLNRTLVLTSLADDSTIERILCVSNSACCEYKAAKGNNIRFRKIPFTKTVIDSNASVFALDMPVERVIGTSSLSELLKE